MKNIKSPIRLWLIIGLLIGSLFLAACSSSGGNEPAADDETMEEMDNMEDMEHEHDDEGNGEVKRIPNEGGAAITITSPTDGETFGALDQVIVDVEVENFELTTESHWHVYVDDVSYGMVMGGNTDQALAGLAPGEHKISVYLSISTHEEYEDGDSITITVEE